MTIETGTAIAIGLPAIGGLVWLIRLEGRINLNENATKVVAEDVKYIRERIDRALNGH